MDYTVVSISRMLTADFVMTTTQQSAKPFISDSTGWDYVRRGFTVSVSSEQAPMFRSDVAHISGLSTGYSDSSTSVTGGQ